MQAVQVVVLSDRLPKVVRHVCETDSGRDTVACCSCHIASTPAVHEDNLLDSMVHISDCRGTLR